MKTFSEVEEEIDIQKTIDELKKLEKEIITIKFLYGNNICS